MTGPLYRLGGFCSRHHWPVIGLWIAAVIAIAVVANVVGEKTSDNLTLPGTGSTSAQNLLSDHLPTQANGTNPVVIKAETGKITDSKNKQAVEDTVKSLRKVDIVQRAVSPFSDAGKGAISKDKKIAYISVTLTENQGDLTDEEAEEVVDAESPAEDAGLKVATGGYLGQAVSKADTESSEAIGLAAAVVILMFAFGTVTAMLLPIVTAVLGLVASLAIIKLLGHVIEVPSVAPTLATMIGLGVGIDYALFIVTRHKLQLKDGMRCASR
jgi:putative drug exporter of the RND superfamily